MSLFTAPSQYLFSGFLLTDNVSYNISHNFSSLCVKLHIQELWKENQQVPGAVSLRGTRVNHHLGKQDRAIAPGEKKTPTVWIFVHIFKHICHGSAQTICPLRQESSQTLLLMLSNFKRYYWRLIPEFLILSIFTRKTVLRIVLIQSISNFDYCLLTTYRLKILCLIIAQEYLRKYGRFINNSWNKKEEKCIYRQLFSYFFCSAGVKQGTFCSLKPVAFCSKLRKKTIIYSPKYHQPIFNKFSENLTQLFLLTREREVGCVSGA